ncbi:phage portal protein [Chitinophaga sp. sic0106]|uniref:phage portal protein n=1 Tax=Chitinophaga sp. sic0106 TaxID=2854785 RepID=UPI001C48E7E7|nr:phage portal protein [Chitinophaga sp. sic0106]MBV7529028.1 phage portal protein [Chitinophaga sp. sic0106]
MKRNLVDRVYEWFSPQEAIRRYHARAVLHMVEKRYDETVKREKRRYDGASKGRHYSDWHSPNLSVNQEVIAALATLRERSRDLSRNNAYAINGVRILRNNVAGTGIIPTPKGGTKRQMKAIKEAWAAWADKTNCDYDDMNTFYGVQALVMKTVIESGECLIRRVRGTSKDAVPLRLQVLEGDFIDSSYHTGVWDTDETITFYGIKLDRRGRKLGYWLHKYHPSEVGSESEFVPASDIIHVYEVERPGQIRGVPFSCGVMLRMKDLDDYEFTERIRSKVAAAFAVFVKEDAAAEDTTASTDGYDLERIEPGMIKKLQPGQEIQVAQPPTTQGFGEFVRNNLRGISAGFGTSYEALTNDYTGVNFSSGRMGSMEFNRNIEHLQYNLIIPRFCDKVFPWFIEACQLKGVIPYEAVITATWTPPRRQMIDPYKEIQALKEGIRAGLYSWQEVSRMLGNVPDELAEELLQDKDMWDKLGLKPTSDARFDSNRPPDPAEQEMLKDDKP